MDTNLEKTEDIIRRTYDFFNLRNIDAVLATVSPEVKWANGWKGGYVYRHEGIREYWTAQWKELDPHVYPVSITRKTDEEVVVEVQQMVKDMEGKLILNGLVTHHFLIRDGLIREFHLEHN